MKEISIRDLVAKVNGLAQQWVPATSLQRKSLPALKEVVGQVYVTGEGIVHDIWDTENGFRIILDTDLEMSGPHEYYYANREGWGYSVHEFESYKRRVRVYYSVETISENEAKRLSVGNRISFAGRLESIHKSTIDVSDTPVTEKKKAQRDSNEEVKKYVIIGGSLVFVFYMFYSLFRAIGLI